MFGFAPSELVGKNVKLLMPLAHHEEHDHDIARYLQTGKTDLFAMAREVSVRRKDGSTLPVWLAVNEVDHLGLFTGIARDMSQVKELQHQLLAVASDEQRRIGQELHDITGQELTGLSLFAGTLVETLRCASHKETAGVGTWLVSDSDFHRLRQTASRLAEGLMEANRHVQELSHGMMPVQVDAEGLQWSLAELAAATDTHDNITCRFDCADPVVIGDNTIATHLYRIAQEALNNALRHGGASQICIALSQDHHRTVLEVSDDGVGFDPTVMHPVGHCRQGMGLRIMEFRASVIGGFLQVKRRPAGGMRVTCVIPGGGK